MTASDAHPVTDGLPIQKIHQGVLLDIAIRALNETGRCNFSVISDSMAPLIRAGDQIFAKSPAVIDQIAGQLVVYEDGNVFVVHRLIGSVDGKYILQGDSRPLPDSPQESKAVVAEVVMITHQAWSINTSDDGVRRVFRMTAVLLDAERKIAAFLGVYPVNGRRGRTWQRLVYRGIRVPISGLIYFLDALPWFFAKLKATAEKQKNIE